MNVASGFRDLKMPFLIASLLILAIYQKMGKNDG